MIFIFSWSMNLHMSTVKFVSIGGGLGAIVGGGIGFYLAQKNNKGSAPVRNSTPGDDDADDDANGHVARPPFLHADESSASERDAEFFEIFTRMAPFRQDAPDLYDNITQRAAALNKLRDAKNKNATMVLKANRTAMEAKQIARKFKNALRGSNGHEFADVESKLHGAIDDRVAQVIADNQL